MNKMFSFFRVALLALIGLTFTSGDEDILTGSSIQGIWSGNMYVTSDWNGRTYTSSRTEIEFYGDDMNVTRGSGYWMDRYSRAPWDYYYSPFTYQVQNGVIHITFLFDGGMVDISNYSVSGNRFTGRLDYTNESFVLYKVDSDIDWDYYGEPGYYDPNGYFDYYNYPYAPAERDFNSTQAERPAAPVRKFWNKQAYEGVEE